MDWLEPLFKRAERVYLMKRGKLVQRVVLGTLVPLLIIWVFRLVSGQSWEKSWALQGTPATILDVTILVLSGVFSAGSVVWVDLMIQAAAKNTDETNRRQLHAREFQKRLGNAVTAGIIWALAVYFVGLISRQPFWGFLLALFAFALRVLVGLIGPKAKSRQ